MDEGLGSPKPISRHRVIWSMSSSSRAPSASFLPVYVLYCYKLRTRHVKTRNRLLSGQSSPCFKGVRAWFWSFSDASLVLHRYLLRLLLCDFPGRRWVGNSCVHLPVRDPVVTQNVNVHTAFCLCTPTGDVCSLCTPLFAVLAGRLWQGDHRCHVGFRA